MTTPELNAAIERVEQRIATAKKINDYVTVDYQLIEPILSAAKEVEQLRRDKERLESFMANRWTISKSRDGWTVERVIISHSQLRRIGEGSSFREAIDSAMSSPPTT